MRAGIIGCLLVLHSVQAYEVKTLNQSSTVNKVPTSRLYASEESLYQGQTVRDTLYLVDLRDNEPRYCNVSLGDSYLVSSVKKLKQNRVLIKLSKPTQYKLLVVDEDSCGVLKEIQNVDCEYVLARVDSFDCIPWRETESARRYSNEGELLESYDNPMQKSYKHYRVKYAEFFDPTPNRSYFEWEKHILNGTTSLKILDSSFRVVREEHLALKPQHKSYTLNKPFSLAHGNFSTCYYNFNYERQAFDIECALVNFDVDPATTINVNIPLPNKNLKEIGFRSVIAVHNLPRGGVFVLYNREIKQVFYRIIEPSGQVGEEQSFSQFSSSIDQHRDDAIGLYLFEEDDSICGVVADLEIISRKCVRVTQKN